MCLLTALAIDKQCDMVYNWRMTKMRTETVDLAEQLRQAIRDAGLTAYAVSRDSGVDRSQIVRFMNGDRDLTLGTASKVASILKLELRPIRRKGG